MAGDWCGIIGDNKKIEGALQNSEKRRLELLEEAHEQAAANLLWPRSISDLGREPLFSPLNFLFYFYFNNV